MVVLVMEFIVHMCNLIYAQCSHKSFSTALRDYGIPTESCSVLQDSHYRRRNKKFTGKRFYLQIDGSAKIPILNWEISVPALLWSWDGKSTWICRRMESFKKLKFIYFYLQYIWVIWNCQQKCHWFSTILSIKIILISMENNHLHRKMLIQCNKFG